MGCSFVIYNMIYFFQMSVAKAAKLSNQQGLAFFS